MPKDFKNKQLVYHLTALDNMQSIVANGLQSRAALSAAAFKDVADHQILDSRKSLKLDEYVPFHFFSKTPFDYAVQRSNRDVPFVLIAVRRSHASAKGWKIVPKHPLCGAAPAVMEYSEGFEAIDWELMGNDEHSYSAHSDYKQTCMAECLSPDTVIAEDFLAIFVKTEENRKQIDNMVKEAGLKTHVNCMSTMFVS